MSAYLRVCADPTPVASAGLRGVFALSPRRYPSVISPAAPRCPPFQLPATRPLPPHTSRTATTSKGFLFVHVKILAMQAKGRETKFPGQAACSPCRRRKSRCKFESDSQACLMCRAHETDCVPVAPPRSRPRPVSTRRARAKAAPPRTRPPVGPAPEALAGLGTDATSAETLTENIGGHNLSGPPPATPLCLDSGPTRSRQPAPLDEAEDDSPHIMGPAIADDENFLEGYLSTTQAGHSERLIIAVFPGTSSSPVVFTRVKKRPLGISRDISPSKAKLQMIEKLIEPHQQDVVDM